MKTTARSSESEYNANNFHILLISILFCGIMSLLWIVQCSGLFVTNMTSSMPMGIYGVAELAEPETGETVIVCPRRTVLMSEALARGYLMKGDKKCWITPLLKRVIAKQGDAVKTEIEGIYVNGVLVPNSMTKMTDSRGRELPRWCYDGLIPEHEYLLLTDNPRSFDGRYFGLTSRDEITHRAYPVLTFSWR